MKIVSWNVNGLRACAKKGFLKWFKAENSDIICLQEVRACKEQLSDRLKQIKNYNLFLNPAKKKGYSGVAVYAKKKPLRVVYKMGLERFDEEARFLSLEFSDFRLINFYMPHGGRGKENLSYKLRAYDFLFNFLRKFREEQKLILAGDFNIAHEEIDLARPKQNQNNIMFTSEERKQIDRLVSLGFVDAFREFNRGKGNYTWWPYFVNARERNLGWRIDYIFLSQKLAPKLKDAFILNKTMGSDHCPVGIEIVL